MRSVRAHGYGAGIHPAAAHGKNSRIDLVAQPFHLRQAFSNKGWLKSTLPPDKVRNCLRWRGPMPNQHAGAFCVVCAALLAANFCIHSDAARAEGINFELLIDSLKGGAKPAKLHRPEGGPTIPGPGAVAPSARKLKPVEELAEYERCLKETRCRFLPAKTGEEVALDLGYSRLFASAYEEVRQRVTNRTQAGNDVMADFAVVAGEEQTIDKLLAAKERHAAAIAYLRALQNGDVAFPDPQVRAPPQLLMLALMYSYPEVSVSINDEAFGVVYRATRSFAQERVKQTTDLSVYEVIGEFRRQIVHSANAADGASPACRQGTALGNLSAIRQLCTRLPLSDRAATASGEIGRSPEATVCKTQSWATLKSELAALPTDDAINLCGLIEQRLAAGRDDFQVQQ